MNDLAVGTACSLKESEAAESPADQPSFPGWLDRFEPDFAYRKAAFCAMYREFLFADDVYFIATAILWGDVRDEDARRLEGIFALVLRLVHGLDWHLHPLCQPTLRATARAAILGKAA